MSGFPKRIEAMRAYREGGRVVYGTVLEERLERPEFYTDGHPHVDSFQVAVYELVEIRDVPVDTSPERRATWSQRNGR